MSTVPVPTKANRLWVQTMPPPAGHPSQQILGVGEIQTHLAKMGKIIVVELSTTELPGQNLQLITAVSGDDHAEASPFTMS